MTALKHRNADGGAESPQVCLLSAPGSAWRMKEGRAISLRLPRMCLRKLKQTVRGCLRVEKQELVLKGELGVLQCL